LKKNLRLTTGTQPIQFQDEIESATDHSKGLHTNAPEAGRIDQSEVLYYIEVTVGRDHNRNAGINLGLPKQVDDPEKCGHYPQFPPNSGLMMRGESLLKS
jgi:hypothetical protein